jgi:hypothetical protein
MGGRACTICSKKGHNARTCSRRSIEADDKASEGSEVEPSPAKKIKISKLDAMFACSAECSDILDRISPKSARVVLKQLASRYAK